MVDICQVVPDLINGRAVVAMVGLDTVWMGEETPMDCGGECAEWNIRIGRIFGTLRMRNM